ncbi:MAG: redoxin domain-containing protein [Gemmataceae bacterium]
MNEVKCPSCQVRLRFRDELGGKTIRCPKCSHRFELHFETSKKATTATVANEVRVQPEPQGIAHEDGPPTLKHLPRAEQSPTSPPPAERSEEPTAKDHERPTTPAIEPSTAPSKRSENKKSAPGRVLLFLGGAGIVLIVAVGCVWYSLGFPAPFQWWSHKSAHDPTEHKFSDNATNNTEIDMELLNLEFRDRNGKLLEIKTFREKKNVVLIFMRGLTENPGGVCPYCSTQTSRLIAQYNKFKDRSSELLVVFPGSREAVQTYLAKAKQDLDSMGGLESQKLIPFPILLDPDFSAVKALKIQGDRAKPATYILDKKGRVRFAYVGRTTVDRPSLKAIFGELDTINAEQDKTSQKVQKPTPNSEQES